MGQLNLQKEGMAQSMKKSFISIFSISLVIILASFPGKVHAVKEFKISSYGAGVQIWFEAEAFDERIPDSDQYFKVTGQKTTPKAPAGAFGEAVTRSGGAGGRISWEFDTKKVDGKRGVWKFWARVYNPNNMSDYMLVKGDPGDDKIPDVPPFPGGDAVAPFDNTDDRIFEATTATWGWWGNSEGSTKELQDGINTMYIFHRQGDATVFWDVFMWTDDAAYNPLVSGDEDYRNAKPMKAGIIAVQPLEKLTTAWGSIKDIQK